MKPVIQPCAAVGGCSHPCSPWTQQADLQSQVLSLYSLHRTFPLVTPPCFHSSIWFPKLAEQQDLKNQKIFTVEDGSGFSHQLPWLMQVPAALGEKLLAIKLLPVRRASWKLSVFNILMKSTIKILTTRLVAFQ